MNADRAAEAAFDLRYVLDVIDMPMGEEEEAQLDSLPDEPVAGAIRSIEEDPALRRLQGVAIRLKNSAGKAAVFDHALSLLLLLLLIPTATLLSSRSTISEQEQESQGTEIASFRRACIRI